jgi:hypothetical protein
MFPDGTVKTKTAGWAKQGSGFLGSTLSKQAFEILSN